MTSISVIIPLYNHGGYIGGALESVVSQSSAADEIIVIDDGSTDDGLAVAEKFLQGHPNVRLFRQPNQGAHVTINRLVKTSRSQYCAVLNSDDQFLPTKLAQCRQILANDPGIDLICGGLSIIDENDIPVTSGETIEWLKRATTFLADSSLPQLSLLNENFVTTTSNMVFSRAIWERSGGFGNLRYCHDLDFLMFAFSNGRVLLDLEHEHIRYRVHPSNTIKEKVEMVRLEVAAVIAAALAGADKRLLGDQLGDGSIGAFYKMIDNKGMPKLIILLQMIYSHFPTREEFYNFVADPEHAATLRKAIE